MNKFEKKFFQRFEFTEAQIERYFANALRDLEIARQDPFLEVRFTYCYQALLKGGIALIAKAAQVKVRSIPGHHIKILEKMSELLHESDILTMGNALRMKRNFDLYGGGESFTEKEAADYFEFVERALNRIERELRKK
ncbi:MAG TPA: hypothetical protein PKL97_06695 [Candidatus Omnitrophota bacterium]|nr:hypothetical protein [Candidatus Omnitrophota bacterium]